MIEVKADSLEASFEGVAMPAVVARPVLAGGMAPSGGFASYVRSGATVEMKALAGTADDTGGYAIPREIDAVIDDTLASISPIRAIANVVKVGSAGYRKLVTSGGTPSGWSAETGARTETDTPAFHEIVPPMGELYAYPAASQAMLDDAAFDVEAWLAQEIASEFARAEGAAFVAGNGTNRPKGFAEQFIGRVLILRPVTERVSASRSWQPLGATPVLAISSVSAVAGDIVTPLGAEDYAIDLDAEASGWVRVRSSRSRGKAGRGA